MDPDFSNYLSSWSAELLSRANRVRNLIGDAHWLSDGHHKENIVRAFLGGIIPPQYQITRGFIRPPHQHLCCSPEIDILITDPAIHPAFFAEGGLNIVPPSSVAAIIEVKTEFNKATLVEAIANQVATQHVISTHLDPAHIWRGVFFATIPDSRTLNSAISTIKDVISNFPDILAAMPQAVTHRPTSLLPIHLPTCLATFDRLVIFLALAPDGKAIRIRAFEGLGLACAVCDLFSRLRTRAAPNIKGELQLMLEQLPIDDCVISDLELA